MPMITIVRVHSELKRGKECRPEQLERPEHYNKVEGCHVEGESNQALEGEHRHGEVKPGQMCTLRITSKSPKPEFSICFNQFFLLSTNYYENTGVLP